MANLFENSMEEESRRNKKKKQKTILLFSCIGAAVVIGIAAIVVFSYFYMNRSFSGYDVVGERERKDSNGVTYLPYQGNLLKYSRDGISAIDRSGKELWNGGYEMEQPSVCINGDYVLVSDIGAKKFYVYNGKDQGICIETMLPIGKAKISSGGRVAVLLQDKDSDVVNIYDPYSTVDPLDVELPTNVIDDGYPLEFDISPDGSSLVIAYMLVQGGTMQNKVCFYNFTDVGQDQNLLVGGKSFETQMISRISFVSEDRVAIFSEDGFTLYENMKKPEEIFQKMFEAEIKSADYDEKNIMVVTGTAGSTENQTLYLYSLRGKEEFVTGITCRYSNLLMEEGEIIFTDDQSCHILRKSGHKKFSFDFGKKCDFFFPSSRDNEYYYIDETLVQLIKLSG